MDDQNGLAEQGRMKLERSSTSAPARSIDIPVYRLPQQQYEAARAAYISNAIERMGLRDAGPENAHLVDIYESHLWHKYGGAWRYNEIVGYIQLRIRGNKVRGEWWAVRAERILRTRCQRRFVLGHFRRFALYTFAGFNSWCPPGSGVGVGRSVCGVFVGRSLL